MNPFGRIGDDPNPSGDFFYSYDNQEDNFSIAASSFHPGGCNFAFLDGSVRFLKESINAWPYNPANGQPLNVTYDSATCLFSASACAREFTRRLATRSGGEIVERRCLLRVSATTAGDRLRSDIDDHDIDVLTDPHDPVEDRAAREAAMPGLAALAHDDDLDAVLAGEGRRSCWRRRGPRKVIGMPPSCWASSRFLPRTRWVAASIRVRSSAGVWM